MRELPEKVASSGFAATAFSAATAAALEMLRAGGNAIDAAVAAAWALAVCEPSGSGLGGKTVMLIRLATGRTLVVDGRSKAPAAVSRERVSGAQQTRGYLACTVPTTVATLGHAQRCFGTLPLPRVMAPAMALAEDGYAVTALHRRHLKWCHAQLQATTPASKLFLDDGRLFQTGQVHRQPALARTLRRLAQAGTEDFYAGQVARAVAQDMARHGGLITAHDLAQGAQPVECEALSAGYRGHQVLSVPPPGGGLQLLLALKVLEHFPPEELRRDETRWYDALSQVIYAVFREREYWPITPERLTPSVAGWMLSDERAAEVFAGMNAQQTTTSRRCPAPLARVADAEGPGETTHLCTADRQDNAVSLTQSIQSLFGAKVASEELGFLYNNCLSTCPRHEHPYQLASRCLPRSNMAPTMVLANKASGTSDPKAEGEPMLALGAAGSRRITSSILQVLSGVIDCGLALAEAVSRPRVHVTLSGKAHIEKTAATPELQRHLKRRFGRVQIRAAHSHFMGAVQAIQHGADGRWVGTADPRRDGNAEGT